MKPYYSDDLVTIYHGDCLTIDATEWLAADVKPSILGVWHDPKRTDVHYNGR